MFLYNRTNESVQTESRTSSTERTKSSEKIDFRDYSEANSAELAVSRLAKCGNARLKDILESLIRHTHAFIKETEPTEDEWLKGIKFLTDVGHTCHHKRQEFVLFSDVLGVSSLVEMIAHRRPGGATESTVLGPFHVAGAPIVQNGDMISTGEKCAEMDKMAMRGRVLDTDGNPISGAVIEVWHADNTGFYDIQPESGVRPDDSDFRAKLVVDKDGCYNFRSVMPRYYPIPNDGPVGKLLDAMNHHPNRPAHIHFLVVAKGFEPLITHIFPDSGPYLDNDVVFGVKASLVRHFDNAGEKDWSNGKPVFFLEQDFVLANDALKTVQNPMNYVPRGSASNFGH
jgi:catechol 1,2-dioxygenase